MPTILILGGGYAGVAAARVLCGQLPESWSITLVDRRASHELLPRLPEVLAGTLDPSMAKLPYRRILPGRVRVVEDEIVSIDLGSRRVTSRSGPMTADFLIICLGSAVSLPEGSDATSMCFTMRSVLDAVALRSHILYLQETLPLLQVAIVGAGYTGTEVAGELSSWRKRSHSANGLAVTMVAEDDRILPQSYPALALVARRVLDVKGVKFALRSRVEHIIGEKLVLTGGEQIKADVVVWATRAVAPDAIRSAGGPLNVEGKLVVDPELHVAGHDRVFACGDSAFIDGALNGNAVAASAQMAVQEGAAIGRNIIAESRGHPQRAFRPRVLGEAITLGGGDGVADVLGIVVTGRAAIRVKQAALWRYLASLGGPALATSYGKG